MEKNSSIQYQVRASYVEIYNEQVSCVHYSILLVAKNYYMLVNAANITYIYLQVQDLLNPSTTVESLQVRWSAHTGFYIENAFVLECESVDDLMAVLEEGE